MSTILDDRQARLLRDEKKYIAELHAALSALKSPPADLENLREALVRLDELFLIVVVGEFNSGKSALLNALLGARVLAEGVTPTTTRVTLVKHGDDIQETIGAEDLAQVTYPLDFLRELNIVDTPGTNAVIREHEKLTRDFIPRSDLVLFVTSTDRPFTESERQFMEHIREWGKKIVLVINKRDLLEDDRARMQVRAFVEQHAHALLGFVPEIFFVSAKRDTLDGPAAEGLRALKTYILSWLDANARLKIKFASPLGVADQLLKRAETRLATERDALASDIVAADTVEREVEIYTREVQGELAPRLAEVDNILYRLEARGADFFDQNMRLTKIANLARGDRFRALFEKQVLAGVPEEIDNRTRAVVEWLVEKDLRHWQQVLGYLQRRRAVSAEQLVGDLTTAVDMRRQTLLNAVSDAAQGVVASYDAEKESRDIGAHVEAAVAQTALAEAGAVGLGTIITATVSAAALDVTGVLVAGILAVLGLFIIPYQRQQAKQRFKEKIQDLRQRLGNVLRGQFSAEAEHALTRLQAGVAPYTRFIRAEKERLARADEQLAAARKNLFALQARVAGLFS